MLYTAGIDVGSSAVKVAIVAHDEGAPHPDGEGWKLVARRFERVRHRDIRLVVDVAWKLALEEAGLKTQDMAYIATTGEGELVAFRTGHFYGMTAHAKGGTLLVPEARAVLDIGALHARAILCDLRGRVHSYRMTSQCASGSGQFIENISRYLGVALEEVGPLSLTADEPEKCSSICAVLAETDVINMVSRGIRIPNILKGIHLSMAGRFVKLLQAAGGKNMRVAVTGGLANDTGMVRAMQEDAAKGKANIVFEAHPDSVLAGALGAAVWGRYRLEKLKRLEEAAPVIRTARAAPVALEV